jgi:hypothetical protein
MASKPRFDTSEDIADGNQSKLVLSDKTTRIVMKQIAKKMADGKSKSKILDDDMLEKKINEVVDKWLEAAISDCRTVCPLGIPCKKRLQ